MLTKASETNCTLQNYSVPSFSTEQDFCLNSTHQLLHPPPFSTGKNYLQQLSCCAWLSNSWKV